MLGILAFSIQKKTERVFWYIKSSASLSPYKIIAKNIKKSNLTEINCYTGLKTFEVMVL